ncbi:hypothetical protein YC2023_084060 [Brassica napus]
MIHTEMESLLTREAPKSSNSTLFDDYGRSISLSSGRDSSLLRSSELSPRLMCRKVSKSFVSSCWRRPTDRPQLMFFVSRLVWMAFVCLIQTPVNIEAKRIRLQSNSYTTNTPLDTVTAAMFQAKEIWGSSRPPVSAKLVEQSTEKKKG